jgi:hypothetical protein
MPSLMVRDRDGHYILTQPIGPDEGKEYYRAWMDVETVTFFGKTYRIHSIARTRPERNLVLCVSYVGIDPSED